MIFLEQFLGRILPTSLHRGTWQALKYTIYKFIILVKCRMSKNPFWQFLGKFCFQLFWAPVIEMSLMTFQHVFDSSYKNLLKRPWCIHQWVDKLMYNQIVTMLDRGGFRKFFRENHSSFSWYVIAKIKIMFIILNFRRTWIWEEEGGGDIAAIAPTWIHSCQKRH